MPTPGEKRRAEEDEMLAELAEQYPDTEVVRIWGGAVGYEAFPKGAVVLRSVTLDGIKDKLAQQHDQPPGDAIK